MEATPDVSIVIPVYNVEKYLGECLDSVLRQTLKAIEVVCVDDGSTDGSPRILADYAAKDPRIRVVTQQNAGLSAARNAGMDAATGEYVCFIDSDDWIADDAMEKCLSTCKNASLDQLVFGCDLHIENGCKMSEERIMAKRRMFQLPESVAERPMSGHSLLTVLLRDGGYYCTVPMRLFRMSALRRAGLRFPEGLIHEDEYFTPLSLLCSDRAMAIKDRLMVYRIRPGSIMSTSGSGARERHLAHLMAIYLRLRGDAKPICNSQEKHSSIMLALAHIMKVMVERKAKVGIARTLRAAMAILGLADYPRLIMLATTVYLKARAAKHHKTPKAGKAGEP